MWGFGLETPVPKPIRGIEGKQYQALAVGGTQNIACLTGVSNEFGGGYNEDKKVDPVPEVLTRAFIAALAD